jgi:hypothetical protein
LVVAAVYSTFDPLNFGVSVSAPIVSVSRSATKGLL